MRENMGLYQNGVVRCKDCVRATKSSTDWAWRCCNPRSPSRGRLVRETDFCPYGVSKDG